MVINATNLRSLMVGYSHAFQKGFNDAELNWDKVATKTQSSTSEQTYGWLGQMGSMREWIGDREVQNMSAYDYTIKNVHFEMSKSISRDVIEDDVYGIYAPVFEGIGQSAAEHPSVLVFDLMEKGFENKCYDKKPFYADNHKVNDEEISNKMTYELCQASYAEARSKMMSFKGDKGKSLNLVPNLLVVPPQLETKGRLILEADYINGTSNIYKNTAELLVEPNLKDPNAWYLLCTKRALKPFIYQERTPIKFVSLTNETDNNVFMQNQYIYGADGRNNAGYGFWQMAIGSTGKEAYPEG